MGTWYTTITVPNVEPCQQKASMVFKDVEPEPKLNLIEDQTLNQGGNTANEAKTDIRIN